MERPPHRPPPHRVVRGLAGVSAMAAVAGLIVVLMADPEPHFGRLQHWILFTGFLFAAGLLAYAFWIRRANFLAAQSKRGYPLIPKRWRLDPGTMHDAADRSAYAGMLLTLLLWVISLFTVV